VIQLWATSFRRQRAARGQTRRLRLLPYLYTLFEECHRTGAPILRPLLFDYPDDEAAFTADAESLPGDALLVAPVTRPGVSHRSAYLPPGTWFQWWRNTRHDGPDHFLAQAPLGEPAIYARANTPIPLWPELAHTGERPPDLLTIVVYPAEGSGASTLYEDEGEGYAHERGAYARPDLACEVTGGRITFRFGAREGSYRPPSTRIDVEMRAVDTPNCGDGGRRSGRRVAVRGRHAAGGDGGDWRGAHRRDRARLSATLIHGSSGVLVPTSVIPSDLACLGVLGIGPAILSP
jgi:alpha-glucosidase